MTSGPVGVIYDVDGVLRLATPRRQVRRMRGVLLSRSPHDRRSVQAMAPLVRALVTELDEPPVFYLTGLPFPMAPTITGLLERDGHPSGTLVTTGPDYSPRWLLGGSRSGKLAAVEHLAGRLPQVRWVLVGDDGGPDPASFADLARRAPGRVVAIGLRQMLEPCGPRTTAAVRVRARCPGGARPQRQELLPALRAAAGLDRRARESASNWFLPRPERGNDVTRLRAWTEGNAVRLLVHGASYFSVLAEALARPARGTACSLVGGGATCEELLSPCGPTIVQALDRAASIVGPWCGGCCGARTRAYSAGTWPANRNLAAAVGAHGGEVLLDQRSARWGATTRSSSSSAIRGILATMSRSSAGSTWLAAAGTTPTTQATRSRWPRARATVRPPRSTTCSVELRGPAVREVDDVFRERWQDPAALSRLPWQVLDDWLRGLPRAASPLLRPASPTRLGRDLRGADPAHLPPAPAPLPYAPRGERSIALAYAKALSRAQRLVYVEDQYLWSMDVARIFAAALRRAPRLQLVAVVPRYPDVEKRLYLEAARLGHGEALAMVREAGGDRVQVLDVENHQGRPVYVHAKLCVVDDVWAPGRQREPQRALVDPRLRADRRGADDERDPRDAGDPAGLGDGARRFARELRLSAPARAPRPARRRRRPARPHPRRRGGPGERRPPRRVAPPRMPGAATARSAAAARPDHPEALPVRQRWITAPIYRAFLDPDGRPLGMRMRRAY